MKKQDLVQFQDNVQKVIIVLQVIMKRSQQQQYVKQDIDVKLLH